MGYSVVRMEQEFKGGGTNYVDSVDLEIKKHEKSGVWFPVSQHYQRVEDGNRVSREEHLKVTVVSLNEPLDPAVFTPAGMNVRPGSLVMYIPERDTGECVWDGSKIVCTRPGEYSSGPGMSRRWLVYVNLSALFILLAIFFLRQYYKRRSLA
jgi:hypothetical protein